MATRIFFHESTRIIVLNVQSLWPLSSQHVFLCHELFVNFNVNVSANAKVNANA